MTFTPKPWQNFPSEMTPRSADAMIDLEERLSGYTDAQVAALGVPALDGRLDSVESSTVLRSRVPVNPKDAPYNAMGNGTTDDTAALLLASEDARNAGRRLYLPAGTYKTSDSVTTAAVNPNRLVIEGDGPETTEITMAAGMTNPVIIATGTLATGVNLAAPVSAGAYQLTFASTTGMAVGQYVRLMDSTQPIYGLSTRVAVSYASEWGRIRRVDSSTQITLNQRLDFGYTTSATARVLSAPAKLDVSGFSIRNLTPGTLAATARGISATYWADLRISDVGFTDMDAHAISIIRGVHGSIESLKYLNTRDLENVANTPYCISASSAQDISIQHVRSRYGRHLYTAGGDTTYGVASHVYIGDCFATEHSATGFDTHPGAIKHYFENCHVHGAFPSAVDLGSAYETSGFQIRGADTDIVNCTAANVPDRGVYIVYSADRCRVVGGRFTDCNVGVDIEDSDDCFIGGDALIQSPRTNGIVFTRNAPYASAMSKVTLGDLRITGNPSGSGINNTVTGLEIDYL